MSLKCNRFLPLPLPIRSNDVSDFSIECSKFFVFLSCSLLQFLHFPDLLVFILFVPLSRKYISRFLGAFFFVVEAIFEFS